MRKEQAARGLNHGERPRPDVPYVVVACTYGFAAGDNDAADAAGELSLSGVGPIKQLNESLGLRIAAGGPDYGTRFRVSYNGRSTICSARDDGRQPGCAIALHARVANDLGLAPDSRVNVEIERLPDGRI